MKNIVFQRYSSKFILKLPFKLKKTSHISIRFLSKTLTQNMREKSKTMQLTSFFRIISLTRTFPPNNEYEDGCGTLGDSPSSPVDTGVT